MREDMKRCTRENVFIVTPPGKETGANQRGVHSEIVAFRKYFGHFLTTRRCLALNRRLCDRANQKKMSFRIEILKALAYNESFFGMERKYLRRLREDCTAAPPDRKRVKRLPDTITVNVAGRETVRHQRWGEHDNMYIAPFLNPIGAQPVQEEKMMSAELVRDSKGKWPLSSQ